MRPLPLGAETEAVLVRIRASARDLSVFGMSQGAAWELVGAEARRAIRAVVTARSEANCYERSVAEMVRAFRTRTAEPLARELLLVLRKWVNFGLGPDLLAELLCRCFQLFEQAGWVERAGKPLVPVRRGGRRRRAGRSYERALRKGRVPLSALWTVEEQAARHRAGSKLAAGIAARLKPVLAARGVPGERFVGYFAFAQRLGRFQRNYTERALDRAAADLVDLYEAKGLDGETLRAIAAALLDPPGRGLTSRGPRLQSASASAVLKGVPVNSQEHINLAEEFSAHNYKPLPVVLAKGEGVWVWDVEGKKYLDMLASYSALNQGHRHPRIVKALSDQVGRLCLTSRAFHHDQFGLFARDITRATGFEQVLPMNTGAEGVETAIKAARKWGYEKKGVEPGKAEIIVCRGNFHGRTTTIVSFSSDELYRGGFGPYTPGFKVIPYNDPDALEAAITADTVAFLVEPVQGEAGINVPDAGYLAECRQVCTDHNVLLMTDEIQTGLGRTGKLFCYEYDNVRPDVLIVGKALGGGLFPVSAMLASKAVMSVFTPGNHGSTFGGNPIACAVAREAVAVIVEEKLVENSFEQGAYLRDELEKLTSPHVRQVRGRGLLIGVEVKGKARPFCEKLGELGILAKETHGTVIRFAPPLTITREQVDWALERVAQVLK